SGFALADFKAYDTIARVRHDLGRSFVGAVLTDREVSGGGHNRVFGPDLQWRPNDTDSMTFEFLHSDTRDQGGLLAGANASGNFVTRVKEQILVGNQLLDQTYALWFLQIDPHRRWPRITLQGRFGQGIDFGGGQVGHQTNFTAATTIRPLDNVTFDVNASREWLDAQGERVYTATIERLKTTYSFSASSLLRVIGQYVDTKTA